MISLFFPTFTRRNHEYVRLHAHSVILNNVVDLFPVWEFPVEHTTQTTLLLIHICALRTQDLRISIS